VADDVMGKSVKVLQVLAVNIEDADLRQQLSFHFSPAIKSSDATEPSILYHLILHLVYFE
jgi:hypothetical protein